MLQEKQQSLESEHFWQVHTTLTSLIVATLSISLRKIFDAVYLWGETHDLRLF